MSTRQRKNHNRHRLIIPVLCTALSAYFYYHSVTGKYGLESYNRTVETVKNLELKLVDLRAERQILENRVILLKNGTIERDMLDEQVRYNLNMMHPDEIAIMRMPN